MDERVKHRLTGVVVIVSVAVIFLPAMLKKSNQRFEENIHISLKLPSKPVPPKVAMPSQKVMFESIKVAHVELPKAVEDTQPALIAKAESLSKPPAPLLAKVEPIPLVKPVIAPEKKVAIQIKKDLKKDLYGVQVASFIEERNAISLVARLNKEGFSATYATFTGKQGKFYQVVVGALNEKTQAINLQKKLAENLQLNGLIIRTGVS